MVWVVYVEVKLPKARKFDWFIQGKNLASRMHIVTTEIVCINPSQKDATLRMGKNVSYVILYRLEFWAFVIFGNFTE